MVHSNSVVFPIVFNIYISYESLLRRLTEVVPFHDIVNITNRLPEPYLRFEAEYVTVPVRPKFFEKHLLAIAVA